ncbi:uncharacterized protein ATNIH1004_002605 [Aspergillus tanneri]|uniref:Uncharacterized protein n=1 Tax=Aspergillus tanneri TaxID=1220188 RepID=A0A5M9MVH5_9EURO|nr:uncharacterized protein ATNIH1004_002605 [Aspergillus tanneri]KAA8649926.1 hypothetical protein ATNIH1004_002605 [Aspergillus tanneri]
MLTHGTRKTVMAGTHTLGSENGYNQNFKKSDIGYRCLKNMIPGTVYSISSNTVPVASSWT